MLLPQLLSDCNADTLGPIAGTCPGPAANPAITFGRVFTRVGNCHYQPDIRLESGWTPGAEPPDPTTGDFCIPYPHTGCGCRYVGVTYRFDGIEIPAVVSSPLGGPAVCFDGDRDGYEDCGDCDDCNPAVHPGAPEVYNGLDDNCNGAVDEGQGTPDSDQDGVADSCDNCPLYANGLQTDSDGDRRGDACDNCQFTVNLDQSDIDADRDGDVCDLDDGLILVDVPDELSVAWQKETAFTTFNLYRGDLAVLQAGGGCTQDPALVPLAAKSCDIAGDAEVDAVALQPGEAVFYLVTGNGAAGESSLGTDSQGVPRANTHPCP